MPSIMKQIMKVLENIAKNRVANLVIAIGALNWGIASWDFNLVEFATQWTPGLEVIVYWVVGVLGAVKVVDLVFNWKARKPKK